MEVLIRFYRRFAPARSSCAHRSAAEIARQVCTVLHYLELPTSKSNKLTSVGNSSAGRSIPISRASRSATIAELSLSTRHHGSLSRMSLLCLVHTILKLPLPSHFLASPHQDGGKLDVAEHVDQIEITSFLSNSFLPLLLLATSPPS